MTKWTPCWGMAANTPPPRPMAAPRAPHGASLKGRGGGGGPDEITNPDIDVTEMSCHRPTATGHWPQTPTSGPHRPPTSHPLEGIWAAIALPHSSAP